MHKYFTRSIRVNPNEISSLGGSGIPPRSPPPSLQKINKNKIHQFWRPHAEFFQLLKKIQITKISNIFIILASIQDSVIYPNI